MSRKSKVMKRALAAKANKKASNGSAVKPQVQGIKKSEKKEVKKSMLLKSIADKSITVVSSPRATACSNKIEKRKHSKIREPVGTSEVNGDEHVAKTVSQSVVAANKSEEAQKQQTKQSALVISVTPSSKKRRNRKKKSKNNSISGQSTLIVQKKTENMSAEHKKVNGEQQKSVQPKPLLIIERSVSTEETSKKRRKRSRKRKSSTLSSQSESASQQPITKRRRLESGVVTTNNLSPASESSAKRPKHTAEEEVSSDSEPEPIHSDWRLNDVDNREGEKEVEASFSDDEVDLDTSEDDVDEEPVEFAEDSSDEEESSEDSEDSEESYFEEEGQDDQDESDEESDKAENDLDSSRYILNGEYPESDDSEDEDFVPVKSSSDEEDTHDFSEEDSSKFSEETSDEEVNFSDTYDFSEEDSIRHSEETSDEEAENGVDSSKYMLNDEYDSGKNSSKEDASGHDLNGEYVSSPEGSFTADSGISHHNEEKYASGRSNEILESESEKQSMDSSSDNDESEIGSSMKSLNDAETFSSSEGAKDVDEHSIYVPSEPSDGSAGEALIKESKKVERVKKSSEAVKSATTGNIRGSIKKFSLSNKSAILLEMKERTAEFGKRCLYVAPIPQDCTFDMIKRFIPKVRTCQFFTKPRSTKFRTYAFLEFADAETAEKERLSIMGRLFAGKSIRAEFRSKLRVFIGKTVSDIDFSRIIVTGLAPDVNQMDLKAIFPSAESVRLPRSNNFNLGHATINFVSDAVALDAFSQCHRYPLKAHPITVNFAFKQPSVKNNLTTTTTSAAVVAPSSTSSEAKKASLITQTRAERVGKVIVQQMKEDSETRSEKEEGKKSAFGLMELIEGSKKRTAADDNDDESSENEGGESVDDDDDDDNNDDMNNVEHGNNNEESSDAGDDDSEGETLDAQLEQVLQARKASSKALKSPGAKRNWKAAHTKGTRPVGAMPKIVSSFLLFTIIQWQ
ncbi:unnamed protein product [Hymenolepis diminuta]|uniref:RRM domain-containing protein n=1 Tax=Hymenolepis diminuta TaxID=6216 RepID=A0A158QCT2_HYMDI|nr:unnamed protein product [Hymenolepis diminuta]